MPATYPIMAIRPLAPSSGAPVAPTSNPAKAGEELSPETCFPAPWDVQVEEEVPGGRGV